MTKENKILAIFQSKIIILCLALALVLGFTLNTIPSNSVSAQPYGATNNWNGTIAIAPKITHLIHSEAKIGLPDAIAKATTEVGENATVDSGSLAVIKGFLVYNIFVLDKDNNLHQLIVDAGDGRVLTDQKVPSATPGTPVNGTR